LETVLGEDLLACSGLGRGGGRKGDDSSETLPATVRRKVESRVARTRDLPLYTARRVTLEARTEMQGWAAQH